jgi:type IV pilus assembly protein PilM
MKLGSLFSSLGNAATTSSGVVGIDVGSSAMKVVELTDRNGVPALSTYGELQLGPYVQKAIGQSVKLEANNEQTALVDLMREAAVESRNAVFAMPLSSSFVTNVSIEADPTSDISGRVQVEAKKIIPMSLSEVTLDWDEIDLGQTEDAVRRNILIVAIQNAALERFKILMQFAGLVQPPTEIECYSTLRGAAKPDEIDIAVIDIGAVSAKMYISHEGVLTRMHRVRAGGALVTEKFAENLEIGFKKAEEHKLHLVRSDKKFPEMKRIHDEVYARAFREFNQVLREYESRTGISLPTILLTGGSALFPGMQQLAQEVLARETQLSDPFGRVAYPAFMEDTLKAIGPSFGVALGAALRVYE